MRKKFSFFIGVTFAVMFFYSSGVEAQVVINEFLASNSSSIVDPDYNENSDWVELYNAGSTAVDLGGYTLTDNLDDREKWKIPSGTQIKSKGFLLIWADGFNSGLHTNFKLSADGEELALINRTGKTVDSIEFSLQEPNVSTGRESDGSSEWALFLISTPGSGNTTTGYNGIVKNATRFKPNGGVFKTSQTVELKNTFGGIIRYTLDGSEPTGSSPVYTNPLKISKTTVVRARIYKSNMIDGPVITHTFFIDTANEIGNLPVFSISSAPAISSAPENFWDSEKGIYVVHDSKPDWEIPINIELFEIDGRSKAAFNLPAGAKSTGLYSWQLPEKMLGISFRKEYGAGKLEYPLIFGKSRKEYDTFSLRASGSDWGNTMFRDGMTQNSTAGYTDIDISGFRACVVYINGEYMGIHNIREKIDEDYVVGNHGVEAGSFDMVEETDQGHYAEAGDLEANNEFLDLVAKDLTNQANYDAVNAVMDIPEFTDMVCTEVYSGNSSIGHNLMKWKPKDSGKWKWILMDLDRGFSGLNSRLISFYLNEDNWPFMNLMKNTNYKKMFGLKLADHLFTTFNQDRIISLIDKHKQDIEAEMPKHITRWAGTHGTGNYSSIYGISSMDYWETEVEKLKTFAEARPNVILNDLTNYGFESAVPISVTTSPAKAGEITFNGLKIPFDFCTGAYPQNEEIQLIAEAAAGYQFLGWKSSGDSVLIAKEQDWKYSDTGTDFGSSWKNADFSDSSWKTGQAEFGYGEDDENTVVSFGPRSSNKQITTYFRKNFSLGNKQNVSDLTLLLKCDDGAVIYLNGNEIQRYNMPTGAVDYTTRASGSISGDDESNFHTYFFDGENLINGNNVIAVEVHQNSESSSDLSFDLELKAKMAGVGKYLSTNRQYTVTTQTGFDVSAIFESNGKCILPEEITGAITLTKACSPYVASADVRISATGKLNIEPGVEIWMSDGASIYASGPINAIGSKTDPIVFKGNPERSTNKWGIISITNVADTSHFSNVIIEDASMGAHPVREVAAISAFGSNLKIDNVIIENVFGNPISARYSDVKLSNSRLHSVITGDLVNFKYGKGSIDGCEFIGNDMPDTDAVDYDGIDNGIIKNSTIRNFHGFNSDAIDIGEQANNILIENLVASDITDKGISVGQQSSANIRNSVFVNCNLGAGLKDSCKVTIDHCTYYGTGTAVACFEKNVGDAGGNVVVKNSILSNSYVDSWSADSYSTIQFSNSLADNLSVKKQLPMEETLGQRSISLLLLNFILVESIILRI